MDFTFVSFYPSDLNFRSPHISSTDFHFGKRKRSRSAHRKLHTDTKVPKSKSRSTLNLRSFFVTKSRECVKLKQIFANMVAY